MTTILLIIVAYLLGSISSAIIVCKLMHLPDPRIGGSQNPGATNVLRLGGKKAAALVLLGDMLKGVIPILVARFLEIEEMALAFVGFAAFIGHLFPIFFRLQGGKGVATAIGVWLALDWTMGLSLIIAWITVVLLFRFSSLASISIALMAPIYMYFCGYTEYLLPMTLISLSILIRHRGNILRLWRGTERKISFI